MLVALKFAVQIWGGTQDSQVLGDIIDPRFSGLGDIILQSNGEHHNHAIAVTGFQLGPNGISPGCPKSAKLHSSNKHVKDR